MKFANPIYENEELTYEDVFLFQKYFEGTSRFSGLSIKPKYSLGSSLPIVSANMNAVTGKRMAEALARLGGIGILPQDMDIETLNRIITEIKSSSLKFDTPITINQNHTIRDAMGIIHKRAHNAIILVDEDNKPVNIFTPKDFNDMDQFTHVGNLKKSFLITGDENINDEEAFNLMEKNGISSLPIINKKGELIGILTKKGAVRNSIYSPAVDSNNTLTLGVALGINNFVEKTRILINLGVKTFVLDTAHGYQRKMIEAIKTFRKEFGDKYNLIAGNVITAEGTRALLDAGANGIKVGVGPGAMCTTRMKTGVGRPQFTAVYECAKEAIKTGGFVWADGGIKEPRDLVLALAAGANHVMIGTTFAGTFESTGDIKFDELGRMYKENYGMASRKAVNLRNGNASLFAIAKKALFKEGISSSKIYIKEGRESVGDIVDEFMTGLRSAMTYIGAFDLEDFYEKATVGVQTNAGFHEGTPHGKVKGL